MSPQLLQPLLAASWVPWYHDACVGRLARAADDALAYFERLKMGLTPDGLIVIKENVCASGFVVDKVPFLPRPCPPAQCTSGACCTH